MTFVAELEPHALWKHFDDLLTIPRPSKHEEKARAYVIAVAERKGLRHREDAIGNVVDVNAGPEVRNFDQIKVGDLLVVRYMESLTLELKKGGAGIRERS